MEDANFLTTLIFQALNFGIVVFVLHKLLYKPVRRIMRERSEAIAQKSEEARQAAEEAEKLRAKYEQQMTEAEAEAGKRAQALIEKAKADADAIRKDAQAQAKNLRQTAEKSARSYLQRAAEALSDRIVGAASALAGAMAADGEEGVDRRAVEIAKARIDELDLETREMVKQDLEADPTVHLTWAAEPTGESGKQVIDLISESFGVPADNLTSDLKVDPSLVAGMELRLGRLIVKAHWRGEIGRMLAAGDPAEESNEPAEKQSAPEAAESENAG